MTRKRVIKKTIKKRKTIKKNKKYSKKLTFRKFGGVSSSEKRLTLKKSVPSSQDSLGLPSLTPEEKSASSEPIELPSLSSEEERKEEEESLIVPSLSPELSEGNQVAEEFLAIPSLSKESFPIRPKTLKKKLITDLKSSPVQQQTATMPRLNESFIDILDQLSSVMLKQGEVFRAKAYQKAQETITSYPSDIIKVDQLKGLPGIGPTITEKLNEYVSTGTLQVLEREKANPLHLLSDVYGIGPKKAKDLIEKGITTIDQLRERQDELLNDTQKVGLKYYEDILQRIPRKEIDNFNTLFKEVFDKVADSTSSYEIVGSYRRGAATSGDIDVIITSVKPDVFVKFMDSLLEKGIILELLSRGLTKSLVIAKLSGGIHARRVDFLYTKPNEYPFSLLYFTGSKLFNTVMRGHALKLGYTLNEHGLSVMNGKVKGDLVSQAFADEQSIFDFLNMEYKTPQERIDGRSVIIKAEKESTFISKADETAEVMNSVVASMINEPALAPVEETIMIKVKKNNTRKKKATAKAILTEEEPVAMEKADIPSYIEQFKKEGISVVEQLTEEELSTMIAKANSDYYNFVPSMSDNEYDILKELMEKKYPSNPILKEVGAPVEVIKNKATLPYEMASMDKIKPDSGALGSWKKKYTGPYVLSGKADGVSGLYTTEGSVAKLYTRGNGIVGQDVSHLIPYLNLPAKKGIVVRGEFILPKKVFEEKYSSEFANARNLVAGIVNRIHVDEKANKLHFVTYETIKPELKPSEQMAFLKKEGFETIVNKVESDITNEALSEMLVTLREEYEYEIDGVIVTNDAKYVRQTGNPEHAFAFKMVLSDQIAEAKVVDVIWTPSKDGYLKPRVRIEPIQLGGVTIEFATGFNGAFIHQHKIGIGSLIEIIRSGDVIPHIRSVTVPAAEPKMPHVPYKWTETHVDVVLENVDADETVREKNILGFFRGIEVVGLSSATISKLVSAGFDSVSSILKMEKADFLKVDGIQEKTANKLYEGIKEQVTKASLVSIMSASNLFGRGFSDKKIELIMEMYPTILVETSTDKEKVTKIAQIKGMSEKTSTEFVSKILGFTSFLEECGLSEKLTISQESNEPVDVSHPLYKKSIVMTGFRDKVVLDLMKTAGASLGSSVSKNTIVVLVKNKDELDTGKALEAVKLGVPIMTPEEFMTAYFPK